MIIVTLSTVSYIAYVAQFVFNISVVLSLCNKFVWQRQIVCKTFSFFFALFTLYHEYNRQMIAEVL